MERNKIYFASDFHLGSQHNQLQRELRICRWLSMIEKDAAEIYLVGDIFDYWFEYRNSIPKGHIHFLSKIRELTKAGIKIHFFRGNHDLWMFDYFPKSYNIPVYANPIVQDLYGKTFYIGHGDGLGPSDYGYKVLKKILTNRMCIWLFSMIHPTIGLALMKYMSSRSRRKKKDINRFLGPKREWLVQHAEKVLKEQPIDYFIFGHRHLPIDFPLSQGSRYVNLGEWYKYNSYAVYDGNSLDYKFFENENGQVFP